MSWFLLGAVFMVCLGLLLGATWTTQALQYKLRQQAEERRKLNQEWVAVRAARRQLVTCPRCRAQLIGGHWPTTPTLPEDPADDD